jgi:hypothetical protein
MAVKLLLNTDVSVITGKDADEEDEEHMEQFCRKRRYARTLLRVLDKLIDTEGNSFLNGTIFSWISSIERDYTYNLVTEEEMGTPLAISAIDGDTDLMTYLIARGARVDAEGHLALRMAASKGAMCAVRLLMLHGSDPLHVHLYGKNALSEAVLVKNYSVVSLIVQGFWIRPDSVTTNLCAPILDTHGFDEFREIMNPPPSPPSPSISVEENNECDDVDGTQLFYFVLCFDGRDIDTLEYPKVLHFSNHDVSAANRAFHVARKQIRENGNGGEIIYLVKTHPDIDFHVATKDMEYANRRVRILAAENMSDVKHSRRIGSTFDSKLYLSLAMCTFLGVRHGSRMKRTDVSKCIYEYVKTNGLRISNDVRTIIPDENLSTILDVQKLRTENKSLTFFNMQAYLKHNFSLSSDVPLKTVVEFLARVTEGINQAKIKWRNCYYSPYTAVGKRRLLNEFDELIADREV